VPQTKQQTPAEIQQNLQREISQILTTKAIRPDPGKIDLRRYRKVRWFFAKAFAHVIFWDIILNRPVLRWFRTPPLPRWGKISRQFRYLAVEMGGVLIKLGQFLSIRVDILPPEVTNELAGLQDEIPPEDFAAIVRQIEADFARPMAELFAWMSPEPLGSASLGQAHLARLASDQSEVVVKVLRPGIDILVETDLAAIRLALRWLKYYKRVSQRVNLDWLSEEFSTVTRNELDLAAEGRNAERFAADFVDDPGIYVPKVYWDFSAARTLTLENVGYIKIGDLEAIDAVGIDRAKVAKKFYNVYMRQIFVTNFVHADPHPGNLFIKPLPSEAEQSAGLSCFSPNDAVPYAEDRPFQLAFVDFGMVAIIPDRLRNALREYAIGVGTRDAYRVVQSYVKAGTLLPGADLKRLEEAHLAMFERFWGVRMGQMREVALNEAQYFLREYRDVIYDAPFQFQVDMLFVVRAVGILSGMSTNLDEEFDPWAETIPFAEKLASEELQKNWRDWLQEVVVNGQLLFKLPNQLEQTLTQAQRGNLVIQTSLSPDTRRLAQRLEQAVNRLAWMVVAAGLLVAGVTLRAATPQDWLGPLCLGLALAAFLWGLGKTR
jgi:predicted unusual protein kinase regulating ubiquinone biosynthesis (AarF/ABC1/UbiB family)